MENYIKQVDIEAKVAKDMALTMFIPAAATYLGELSQTVSGLKATVGRGDKGAKSLTLTVKSISTQLAKLQSEVSVLDKAIAAAAKVDDIKKKGKAYLSVRKQTEVVRNAVDSLEEVVAADLWPVPKYSDMLIGL
jgi:glutamine synthetase